MWFLLVTSKAHFLKYIMVTKGFWMTINEVDRNCCYLRDIKGMCWTYCPWNFGWAKRAHNQSNVLCYKLGNTIENCFKSPAHPPHSPDRAPVTFSCSQTSGVWPLERNRESWFVCVLCSMTSLLNNKDKFKKKVLLLVDCLCFILNSFQYGSRYNWRVWRDYILTYFLVKIFF